MKSKLSRKNLKRYGWIALLIAIVAVGWRVMSDMRGSQNDTSALYEFVNASKRDITVSLSGAGTLKPANAYTVVSLISGDIVSAPFEEGDILEKNALLYEIDSSNIASSIETAEISLSDSERIYRRTLESFDRLSVTADDSGRITSLLIKLGDTVTAGQTLARVTDDRIMTLDIPFLAIDASSISAGDTATLILTDAYERLTGKVTRVSTISETLATGAIVHSVTIEVNNPGALTPAYSATAQIGDKMSQAGANFKYRYDGSIIAKISGDVSKIHFAEGDYINKGDLIIKLESQSLSDELVNAKNNIRRAQISLENQNNTLDNYLINSPISGTVIEKNYKEGDTVESGKIVSTIFDLSYLTLTLNIDELDISKVALGQKVFLTADAVPSFSYEGVVTKININGFTSGGTTSYPVTIRIDETKGLLPGMNVDARIVIESKTGVLAIPNDALLRGSRILMKSIEPAQDTATDAPEGFRYVRVETGVSDNDYIEITSGLSEGDEVAIEKRIYNNTLVFPRGRPGDPDTSYEEVETP